MPDHPYASTYPAHASVTWGPGNKVRVNKIPGPTYAFIRETDVGADAILTHTAENHCPIRILSRQRLGAVFKLLALGQIKSATGVKIASARTLRSHPTRRERKKNDG